VWEPEERALAHWEEARSLLSAGKAEESLGAISEALVSDPKNATLWLWKAQALAAHGDFGLAIEAASRALLFRGDFVEALYNRGCWLSRIGDLENAVLDIERVVALGGIDRHTMAKDPDLDPLRADPRFSSKVPARELLATAEADSEAFFVGSRWSVVLSATLPAEDDALEVYWLGESGAPLELIRLVEDRIPSGVLVDRRLEYVFRVMGAGEGQIGPWRLAGGGLEATLGAVNFRFLDVPGRDATPDSDLRGVFLAPEQRLGSLQHTGAVRGEKRVLARGFPGDSLELTDQAQTALEIEVRRDGQPQWLAWEIASQPGARVAIRRDGSLVYEGNP